MKPGYKTTEFWLTVAASVVGFLMMSGVVGDGSTLNQVLAFIGNALAVMGYSFSRGLTKSG